jgi:hypothetical protein
MVVSSHMMLCGLFGCPDGNFRKKMIARGAGNGQSESQAGDRDAFALLLRSIGPAFVTPRGFASPRWLGHCWVVDVAPWVVPAYGHNEVQRGEWS